MEEYKVKLKGIKPLLLHNPDDILEWVEGDPYTRQDA